MTHEDCYECDRCGETYSFIDAYDQYTNKAGFVVYIIHNWYGECDGQDMCENCWDDY